MPNSKEDYLPTASIELLKRRAKIIRAIRSFFDARGFFEVETPLLSHDIVVDRHLHPISLEKQQVTGRESDRNVEMWLQTSPEFAMKRLLVAGATAIYQICKAFRRGESGNRHNPEFTMLEWYRVGDDMAAGMNLLGELVQETLDTASPVSMSYRDAFLTFAGIDPYEASDEQLAKRASLEPEDRDEMLNVILSTDVEPKLGFDAPVVLYHYPASQAALARESKQDGFAVAERFEIYVRGVELANGYSELVDATELRRRNRSVNLLRKQDNNSELPVESRLLNAMGAGLPACSGTALGIDRLVMLATGAQSIKDVIPFPIDRA
ncbi:MAG: EF-P lysine aminoacylase EpmA [Planctomycetota bacterium]